MCIAKEQTIKDQTNTFHAQQFVSTSMIQSMQTNFYGNMWIGPAVPVPIPNYERSNQYNEPLKADLNLCSHLVYIDNNWISSKGNN